MNCDQVFDILTRGPFPAGQASDAQVERHLTACHDCRQLAEALRPAVELFHEAIEPQAGRDLPGYRGQLSPAIAAPLPSEVEAALGVVVLARRVRPRLRLPGGAGFPWALVSASVVLGLGLGALLWAVGITHQPLRPSLALGPAPTLAAQAATGQAARHEGLSGAVLPAACFTRPQAAGAVVDQATGKRTVSDLSQLLCCTKCHALDSGLATPRLAIAMVSAACRACHAEE